MVQLLEEDVSFFSHVYFAIGFNATLSLVSCLPNALNSHGGYFQEKMKTLQPIC